jgi:hypothetical protein
MVAAGTVTMMSEKIKFFICTIAVVGAWVVRRSRCRSRASLILKNNVELSENESLVCVAAEKLNLKERMRSRSGELEGAPTRSKPTSIQLKYVDYD